MNIYRSFFVFVIVLASTFASPSEAQTKKFNWASTAAAKNLGVNFISPAEVTEKFGEDFIYTEAQLEELWRTIPSSSLHVGWLKNNHYVLMPGPAEEMSLPAMRGGVQDSKKAPTVSFGWLAIKRIPFRESVGKSWLAQSNLLSRRNERVPNAAELVWYLNTYLKVRGVKLFSNVLVRSSSLDDQGNRIVVGLFKPEDDDPMVCSYPNDGGDPLVGIAVAGKK